MRLVSYHLHGDVRLGALADGRVVDLQRAYRLLRLRAAYGGTAVVELPSEGRRFLEGGPSCLSAARDALAFALELAGQEAADTLADWGIMHHEEAVRLKPPVLEPQKIIGLGLNYADHARETNTPLPEVPQLFPKYPNSLIGPREPILLPRASQQIDIEAELAFVIGRPGRHIPAERAMEHVAGYCAFNDVSARDFQFATSQFTSGKILDTAGPIGPLVTADEVPDPHALRVRSWIDDQPMQDSSTDQLVFKIPQIIAFVSQLATLQPGDIFATGTPPGVGFARKPPVFLRPGQTAIVEVEGVGRLENPAVAEEPA